jgi:hypothetical protein
VPVIGVVEMVVGRGHSRRLHAVGRISQEIWPGGIAVNLLTTGHYFCVAARDMTTAFAAFTLARLTEAGAGAEARDHIGESGLIDRGTKV